MTFLVGVICKWVDEQGKVHHSDKPSPVNRRRAKRPAEKQRLTGQIQSWHCYPVPVEGVWLASKDYTMRAPPER